MTPAEPLDAVPIPAPRAGLTLRGTLLVALIAFVIGLAATAWLLSRWDGWRAWTGEADRARTVAADGPGATGQPVAALPGRAGPDPYAAPPATIDAAEAAAREAQLGARIAQLESRLAAIDVRAQAASGNASRAEGLLVAFAARRALDRGQALGYLEAQLRDLFGPVQPRAVAVVIQASRAPVTLEALRIGLDELTPELTSPVTGDGWWPATRRELSSLIVLRRTGTPSPRAADRLTRARRMLEGGQVDAALAEVARLPGADRAAAWMIAARRFNQARRALDVLETAAILAPSPSGLTASPPPAAPAASAAPVAAAATTAPLPTE